MSDALAKYEGRSFCYQCSRNRPDIETEWRRAKRGLFVRCSRCGTRFPCRKPCEHFDCEAARAELSAAV